MRDMIKKSFIDIKFVIDIGRVNIDKAQPFVRRGGKTAIFLKQKI